MVKLLINENNIHWNDCLKYIINVSNAITLTDSEIETIIICLGTTESELESHRIQTDKFDRIIKKLKG